jgi:NADH:ubiquinone oxidoreductase subunit E
MQANAVYKRKGKNMTIKVCIGSACHLKGSYEVIQKLKESIEQHQLEGQVHLRSSFCLGACSNGVSVQVDEREVRSLSPDTVEAFFEEILKEVNG